MSQKPKCPQCDSSKIATERRPNGNSKCLDCYWEGPAIEANPPKQNECPHPDEYISGSWHYVGDKLENASGYCRICGLQFYYCKQANKLVKKENVKESLKPDAVKEGE